MSHIERAAPPAQATRVTVGVVAERRASGHPWADATWRPVAVIPGGGPPGGPRRLDEGADRAVPVARWYVGCAEVELFAKETDGYRQNLAAEVPKLFVVLRAREAGEGVVPFLATACPYEAQAYLDSEEIVEGVPLPPAMTAWLEAFVVRHHVDEPFVKRKQKPKKAGADADPFRREPPVARSRREGSHGR